MNELKPLGTIPQFLFGAPLYTKFKLEKGMPFLRSLYPTRHISGRSTVTNVDGHCPECKQNTIYFYSQLHSVEDTWDYIGGKSVIVDFKINCSRNGNHKIIFFVFFDKGTVQKIGQLPSLADISNDEVARYRKYMPENSSKEFHRAIGLAAHGVGIGSYVYMRRVFERLVQSRFDEFKEEEAWSEDEFNQKKMTEKIELLDQHLPDFLVQNKKIYSILSLGIHELSEEKCLAYFEVLKDSIIMILEDDKKKREEIDRRRSLQAAIDKFQHDSDDQSGE